MVQIRLKDLQKASGSFWTWLRCCAFVRRDVRDLCRMLHEALEQQEPILTEQHRLRMEIEDLRKRLESTELEAHRNKKAAVGLFEAAVSRSGFDNEKEGRAFLNLARNRQ